MQVNWRGDRRRLYSRIQEKGTHLTWTVSINTLPAVIAQLLTWQCRQGPGKVWGQIQIEIVKLAKYMLTANCLMRGDYMLDVFMSCSLICLTLLSWQSLPTVLITQSKWEFFKQSTEFMCGVHGGVKRLRVPIFFYVILHKNGEWFYELTKPQK